PPRREAAPDGDQPAGVERVENQERDRRVEEAQAQDDACPTEGRGSPPHDSTFACWRWKRAIGMTRVANSTMATAEAAGQSRSAKNSVQMVRPSIKVFDPPSSSGITNSPTIGMKQRRAPAATPGSESGKVTRQNAPAGVQPRSCAASIRLSSCFS